MCPNKQTEIKNAKTQSLGFPLYLIGFAFATILFSATFTDFTMRSAVGTIANLGANLATRERISGIGHLGFTLSEILHIGATKIAPWKAVAAAAKWIRRQIAPPMDSPKRTRVIESGPTFAVGLNFDFVVLNLTKHSSYLIYNAALYFSSAVQAQYFEKYGSGQMIPVAANDVAFSIHAVLLTVVTLYQIAIYERRNQKVSKISIGIVSKIALNKF